MSDSTSSYSQPISTRPVRPIDKPVLFISTGPHLYKVNIIRIDDEQSQSLIKGVTLGTVTPGETVLKTLYVKNTGGMGDRVVDISIQSRSPVAQDTSEVLRTLSVPTVAPMKVEYGVKYLHSRGVLPGLTDLRTYESDYWDDGEGGEALVSARMACVGPWGVSVETVRLVRKVSLRTLCLRRRY